MIPTPNVMALRAGLPANNLRRPVMMPGAGAMLGTQPGAPGVRGPIDPRLAVSMARHPVTGQPIVRPMMGAAAPQISRAALPQPGNALRMRMGLR